MTLHRKADVKALFFDIDGTLVNFKSHAVPPSAISAICRARQKGVKAFIATGRAFFQIPDLGGLDFDGFITQNGVLCITDSHEVVERQPVCRADLDALFARLDAKPFSCSFMTESYIAINFISPRVEQVAEMVNVPAPAVRDLREVAARDDVFQINVYVERHEEEELLRNVFSHCEASRWNPLFADINARGFSKQTGIDKFVEHYGFSLDQTMAFGDGGNDISMIRHAAIGVAMGNAMDEVKAEADYVTASVDEDGIAKALEAFGVV